MAALLVANLKIMVRDRQALFWALAFPLVLVVVFGIFDLDSTGTADIAVVDRANDSTSAALKNRLIGVKYLNVFTSYRSEDEARADLEDGDLEYVLIIPEGVKSLGELDPSDSGEIVSLTLYHDINNEAGNQLVLGTVRHFVDEQNLRLIDQPQPLAVLPREVDGQSAEYFDILLIGLLGMGMMTNSIVFIAVKISLYRNQSILKRILFTPLRVRNYFAAEILAHLLLALVQAAVVIGFGVLVFGANINGNLLWLFMIVAFASTIFLNVGFIISGWASSPRAASGMGNAVAIPMLFFSGTFFPTSSLPSFMPELVQVLPLTPMLEALRGVAIDGEAIWEVWRQLAMLAGWLVFSSVAAIKMFRFG